VGVRREALIAMMLALVVMAEAAPSTGRLLPGLPTADVGLTIDGVVYTATLPSVPAGDLWLSGPLVYEGRSIVAPASSAVPLPARGRAATPRSPSWPRTRSCRRRT